MTIEPFDAVLAEIRSRCDVDAKVPAASLDRLAAAHAAEVGHQSRCAQEWFDRFQKAEARAEAAERERDKLRAFAQSVMECWPIGDLDGGSLQDTAEANGLLRAVTLPGPCGEDCACTEYLSANDWPAVCYRKTTLLTGQPKSDAAIDACIGGGEGK